MANTQSNKNVPDYEAIGRAFVQAQEEAAEAARKDAEQVENSTRTKQLIVEALQEDRQQQVAKAAKQLSKAAGYAFVGALVGAYASFIEDIGT